MNEFVYCVAVTFKMTEKVEQWICIKSASNFVWSLNIPLRKLFGWFRRLQLWATGDWQLHHDNAPAHVSPLMQFIYKTLNHPGDSAPYGPDLVPRLFPKLKSLLKGKRFQTVDEIQENMMGQVMASGRTVWGPKVPTLNGTKVSLSYVQCFLYFVSSPINVSVFHMTWLGTLWTDVVLQTCWFSIVALNSLFSEHIGHS